MKNNAEIVVQYKIIFSFGNFKTNIILLQINFFPRFAIHVMSNYMHPAHINVKKVKIIKDFSF
jgi:hypothetical protein